MTNTTSFKIGIYTHPSTPISSVAGVWDIFTVAKQLVEPEYQLSISLIGSGHFSQHVNSPICVYPEATLEKTEYDLIIISALGPIPKKGIDFDIDLKSWIRKCSDNGAAIATVCTGAFLLASTGLLDQRRATTHWKMASRFREQFPKVELRIENMLTHDGSFFCSGGAYAFQDLCVYLIETYFGKTAAKACSELLMIDLTTRSQLAFAGFQALKLHNDRQVLAVQNWLEDNLVNGQTVDEIASQFNMSSRNLIRRFKSATNETPSAYIQKLKIEQAKYLLMSNDQTIDSIAYEVGYQDVQYFRALFKRICGMTPSQFRSNKEQS